MKAVEYILTGEEMQIYDKNTVNILGIPSFLLMEQAALAALEEIIPMLQGGKDRILILSGTGNNGGDALALARLLFLKNYDVTVCIVNNKSLDSMNFSKEAQGQLDIIKKMGISIVTELPSDSYDMIIDGIFGVGLNREIKGKVYQVISKVNTYGGVKIALDLPSGLDATSGKIHGICFSADATITFAFYKRGLFLGGNNLCCGKIIKKEIGITEKSFAGRTPAMEAYTGEILPFLPPRKSEGHKGTFGKILIVGGSEEIGGAVYLSAKAAFLSGCGMVRICTHKKQYSSIFSLLPEAMFDCYSSEEEAKIKVLKGIEWADVIVMGPGMGKGDISRSIWKTVITKSKLPLVLDADALNILSEKENTLCLQHLQQDDKTSRTLILTPHLLELSRLCNKELEEVKENWEMLLTGYSQKMKAIVVKKDARTIVGNPCGEFYLNLSGNHGMATAGSGDVLCGIIGAFLAVFQDPFMAVKAAVYCHGRTGDIMAKKKGFYSLMAGDLLEGLSLLLNEKNYDFPISGRRF